MAVSVVDSSALVKRYVRENGTAWVRGLTDPAAGHTLYIAGITGVTVDLTPRLMARAMGRAETHALRGYDAVQCAVAVEIHCARQARGMPVLTLVSADAALHTAAAAEGLLVEDPNAHP